MNSSDVKQTYKMDYKKRIELEAKTLTREKRQEFMDLMFNGKNIGEASKICGISSDTACGILNLNIQCKKFFRRDSV